MTTTPDAIVRNGPILDTYRAFEKLPFGGRWLFSRALCLKAPYFGSIRPRFDDLRPGFGRVRAPLRRAVKNHLGTFHAIACCNLAEVTAGTTLDASLPRSHRWIPKGMTVSSSPKPRPTCRPKQPLRTSHTSTQENHVK
jgi:hypothetical protein